MSPVKARREASKRLGFALAQKFRELSLAVGPDEIQAAAIELGSVFNDNIEFTIWVLKEYGGVQQKPFQPEKPALPKISSVLTGQDA